MEAQLHKNVSILSISWKKTDVMSIMASVLRSALSKGGGSDSWDFTRMSTPDDSSEASSATNDVVTFNKGMLNILDTRLNTDIDTPTAASSTGPCASFKKYSISSVPYW